MIRRSRTARSAAASIAALALVLTACADPDSEGPSEKEQRVAEGKTLPTVEEVPEIAETLPADIREAGKLVMATNAPYPPLEFFDTDNKTLIGYDIDLGDAIGDVLGVKVEWKNISFDGIIPGLQADKYDAGMAGFSIESERLPAVDFVSYYLSGGGFLIKKGSGIEVSSFEDMCGLRVAVQKGVSQVEALQHASEHCEETGEEPIEISQIPDQNVVVLNLQSNRADVAVGDKPQVEYAAGHSDGELCVISTYQTQHSIAGIAVPKGNDELTAALQAAINELIETGDYAQISEFWGTGIAVEGATLSEEYEELSAPWGVGPDGTVKESLVFTDPSEIEPGHTYYYQPINPGCA